MTLNLLLVLTFNFHGNMLDAGLVALQNGSEGTG